MLIQSISSFRQVILFLTSNSRFQTWEPTNQEVQASGPNVQDDEESLTFTEDVLSTGIPVPSSYVGQTIPTETVKNMIKDAFARSGDNQPEESNNIEEEIIAEHERNEEVDGEEEMTTAGTPHIPLPKLGPKPQTEFKPG